MPGGADPIKERRLLFFLFLLAPNFVQGCVAHLLELRRLPS